MWFAIRVLLGMGAIFSFILPGFLLIHTLWTGKLQLRAWRLLVWVPTVLMIGLLYARRTGSSSAVALFDALQWNKSTPIALVFLMTSSLFCFGWASRSVRPSRPWCCRRLFGRLFLGICLLVAIGGVMSLTISVIVGLLSTFLLVPLVLGWSVLYRGGSGTEEVESLAAGWMVAGVQAVAILCVSSVLTDALEHGAYALPWKMQHVLVLVGLPILSFAWASSRGVRPELSPMGVLLLSSLIFIGSARTDLAVFNHIPTYDHLARVPFGGQMANIRVGPTYLHRLANGNLVFYNRTPHSAEFSANTPLRSIDFETKYLLINQAFQSFELRGNGTHVIDRLEDGWRVGKTSGLYWEETMDAVRALPAGESLGFVPRRSITLQDLVDLCSIHRDRDCRIEEFLPK